MVAPTAVTSHCKKVWQQRYSMAGRPWKHTATSSMGTHLHWHNDQPQLAGFVSRTGHTPVQHTPHLFRRAAQSLSRIKVRAWRRVAVRRVRRPAASAGKTSAGCRTVNIQLLIWWRQLHTGGAAALQVAQLKAEVDIDVDALGAVAAWAA